MDLPHADEIRRLRAVLYRSQQASAMLGGLERAMMALALGSRGESPDELLSTLRTDWPEVVFSDEGGAHAALTQARRELLKIATQAEGAGRDLRQLSEGQWLALQADDWTPVRNEILALMGSRAATMAALGPVQQLVSGLGPMRLAIADQLSLTQADLEKRPNLAQQRLAALVNAISAPLSNLSAGLVIPELDPDAPVAANYQATLGLLDQVDRTLSHVGARRDALMAEVADIESNIQERMG